MRRERIYGLYGYWEPDRYGNLRYVRYKDPISFGEEENGQPLLQTEEESSQQGPGRVYG